MDKKAFDLAMDYWNKGTKKYLTGGSDQHDATSGLYPGKIRMYVHMDGQPTLSKYFAALKQGHTYTAMGPILTPAANTEFGSTQQVAAGQKHTLNTEIQSVLGLARVDVYSKGKIIATKELGNVKTPVAYTLDVQPTENTWYSFVVVDSKGHYAVTNPVWINIRR